MTIDQASSYILARRLALRLSTSTENTLGIAIRTLTIRLDDKLEEYLAELAKVQHDAKK